MDLPQIFTLLFAFLLSRYHLDISSWAELQPSLVAVLSYFPAVRLLNSPQRQQGKTNTSFCSSTQTFVSVYFPDSNWLLVPLGSERWSLDSWWIINQCLMSNATDLNCKVLAPSLLQILKGKQGVSLSWCKIASWLVSVVLKCIIHRWILALWWVFDCNLSQRETPWKGREADKMLLRQKTKGLWLPWNQQ